MAKNKYFGSEPYLNVFLHHDAACHQADAALYLQLLTVPPGYTPSSLHKEILKNLNEYKKNSELEEQTQKYNYTNADQQFIQASFDSLTRFIAANPWVSEDVKKRVSTIKRFLTGDLYVERIEGLTNETQNFLMNNVLKDIYGTPEKSTENTKIYPT